MFQHVKHQLPITQPKILLGVFIIAWFVGCVVDNKFDTSLDAIFHDAAIVQTERQAWQHVAIVALDPGVPGFISRRQALPLYSLAAQRVLEMGATAVFLDAVLYEYDHRISYAVCVEEYKEFPVPHQFRWQESTSLIPFANLTPEQFQKLFIAKPQFAGNDDFITLTLLQSFFGEELLPLDFFELENNTLQLQRLIADASIHKRNEGIFDTSFRWMNISDNAVVPKVMTLHRQALPHLSLPNSNAEQGHSNVDNQETCNQTPCQRVRFSHPKHNFKENPALPVVPVSDLAGCQTGLHSSRQHSSEQLSSEQYSPEQQPQKNHAQEHQRTFKDKVVILQLTSPSEATDIKVTPMISALGSPGEFLTGPQFLADAVETAAMGDSPRQPSIALRWLVIGLCTLISVLMAAYAVAGFAFFVPLFTIGFTWALCFVTAPTQLWPVAAVGLSSVLSMLLMVAIHISMGTAKAKLMAQYIPPQIRKLLLKYKGDKKFIHKNIDAVILMSDIAKYSNVTSELKDPAYVFQLLNHYFEETTLSTQEKYAGWLESYVGDMVCFYWPVHEGTVLEEQQKLALLGAIDMANRQQQFFKNLVNDSTLDIPKDTLQVVATFIGAGIGLTSGKVMMGNLGPEKGIQKFGCLGDPLNLASRTESLTRHFNTEILITEELAAVAKTIGLRVRTVARVIVKGRLTPVNLCALGEDTDPRFNTKNIEDWETWYQKYVSGQQPDWPESLHLFSLDKQTIKTWVKEGLWEMHLESFVLQQK